MISGYLDIDGARLTLGEELHRLELIFEYSMAANGITAELDYFVVRSHFPEVHRRRHPADKVQVMGCLELENGPRYVSGFLDPIGGGLSSARVAQPADYNATARSLLGRILDDAKENKMTLSMVNADCSDVVREVCRRLGVRTSRMDVSGVQAGEEVERGGRVPDYLYSADNKLAGEILKDMVKQTGFVCNVSNDNRLYFVKHLVVPHDPLPLNFFLRVGDPEGSTVDDVQHAAGAITTVTIARGVAVELGSQITVEVADDEALTGRYYVTRARYQGSSTTPSANLSEFAVAAELPKLEDR